MIASFLKNLFSSSEPAEAEGLTPELAAATLLVEAALSDGVYAESEARSVQIILEEAFELSSDAAAQLRDRAEEEAEQAVDAHRFTRQVKSLPEAQRIKVVEGLYFVSLADGDRCKFEDAFIRHIASLLHIEDVVRAKARQRAEARNSLPD